MKILDRYILSSFIKTFLAVFLILMFIFVLQGVWLHIDELAGKDLDYEIVAKFLFYLIPIFVPMVLPLTILVTSIMTFGSFSENYEFAAMKSSGISLQRAMRGLTLFIGVLSIVAFFFANNVIPWAEYKSINLRYNIRDMKPAMAIVEGSFNQLGDINIKVKEKSGENDQYLSDVIIHKNKPNRKGNYTVIKAERGELTSGKSTDILSLILYNGNYYDELLPKDYQERQRKPYVKSYFEQYRINIDLSSFNEVDFEKEDRSSQKMLDVSELKISIDSLSQDLNETKTDFTQNILLRSGIKQLGENPKRTVNKTNIVTQKTNDTTTYKITNIEEFFASYSTRQQQQIMNIAAGAVRGTVSNISGKKQILRNKVRHINKTEIQLHEKYALAVACFVLFFVGAPLGAIIRKGGLGLPMVIAILLFLTYHFIGIFAKNSAEDNTVSPFVAAWISTLIMLPLGVYLTYRATTDQGFVNTDGITEPVKKFFGKLFINKQDKK
ncbi:LptF/LptG family permease [Mesonia hippocampi]|nr:LptF/LptG family permease [Mesonia hippocampi]